MKRKQIVRPGVKLQDHYKYIHLEIVRFSFTIEFYTKRLPSWFFTDCSFSIS